MSQTQLSSKSPCGSDKCPIRYAISVDVEEYYHANNLLPVAPPSKWNHMPSRVEATTQRILDLFDAHNTRGTFFILGHVARRQPKLVKAIAERGHEIASHGYGHRVAFGQSFSQFKRDVDTAKKLLEDIAAKQVYGYRAPSFSIGPDNEYAYDALIESGYHYDSSLYPIAHPRYGNKSSHLSPFRLKRPGGELLIYPLAVNISHIFGKERRLPVAGGAYWRFFPKLLVGRLLKAIVEQQKRTAICYIHPWELDGGQPVFRELPWITLLRHHWGTWWFEKTVDYYTKNISFGAIEDLQLNELQTVNSPFPITSLLNQPKKKIRCKSRS